MTVSREARIEAIIVLIKEGWNPPTPSETVFDRITDSIYRYHNRPEITPAHVKVLEAAARGLSTNKTARQLGLSPHTVRDQRKAAIVRLDARNMTHAVAIAVRKGLIAA